MPPPLLPPQVVVVPGNVVVVGAIVAVPGGSVLVVDGCVVVGPGPVLEVTGVVVLVVEGSVVDDTVVVVARVGGVAGVEDGTWGAVADGARAVPGTGAVGGGSWGKTEDGATINAAWAARRPCVSPAPEVSSPVGELATASVISAVARTSGELDRSAHQSTPIRAAPRIATPIARTTMPEMRRPTRTLFRSEKRAVFGLDEASLPASSLARSSGLSRSLPWGWGNGFFPSRPVPGESYGWGIVVSTIEHE